MPKRPNHQVRPIRITPYFVDHPEGSVLIEMGDTRVLCNASVEERMPSWLAGKDQGWITAEYDMLPRATGSRRSRDSHRGKINGRTQEIGRLIGRSLRAAVDLKALANHSITVDCDVIQADGGTRTAAITGGFIALSMALELMVSREQIKSTGIKHHLAAISVGIVDGEPTLDLDYRQDSNADVDMNVIMTEHGNLVEIQGTAERNDFSRTQLNAMLDLAMQACPVLVDAQKQALATKLANPKTSIMIAPSAA